MRKRRPCTICAELWVRIRTLQSDSLGMNLFQQLCDLEQVHNPINPPFPHLSNGHNEIMHANLIAQCLAVINHSLNTSRFSDMAKIRQLLNARGYHLITLSTVPFHPVHKPFPLIECS